MLGGSSASAWTTQTQPWCALVESAFDCSYYTYNQCMVTASGNSRYCIANPNVMGIPDDRAFHPRRKRVRYY